MFKRRHPAILAAFTWAILTCATEVEARSATEINVFAWQVVPPVAVPNAPPDLLIGTMHVAIQPGKRLPDALTRRLVKAKRFAMEVDLSKIPPDVVARYVMLPPDQKSLQEQLPAPAWTKLVELAKTRGLTPERITRMAPWFVSMAFLDLDTPGEALMDAKLREQAESQGVPITFLETAEEQFQALAGVEPRENIGQLEEMLDDPTRPKRELAELEKAYRGADLASVEKKMFGADRIKTYPDFYRRVFWNRNAHWEPMVETMFAPGGAVVAVGLGHMLGERGLVSMLTRHGYKVTPLTL